MTPGQPVIDTDIPRELRGPILDAVLRHVDFDGWTQKAVRAAAADLELAPAMIELAFPGGITEMIDTFSARADEQAAEAIAAQIRDDMKIRDRIALAVRVRIEGVAAHREAARHAISHLCLPPYAAAGAAMTWRTADVLWRAVGDTSTDMSHYSKRAILAGVFSATVLYWLNDVSEGSADTWSFLDRRIGDVMKIEKAKGHLRKYTAQLPDFARMAGRMRYGKSGQRG
ncbi:MAG: COQ9 family protein [Sphingomonadales bacterium]